VQFQVCLYDAEIEATTWSIADMDRIVNQLDRLIYGITSADPGLLMNQLSIRFVMYKAWWQAIGVQKL
jgi:hypothetical protein